MKRLQKTALSPTSLKSNRRTNTMSTQPQDTSANPKPLPHRRLVLASSGFTIAALVAAIGTAAFTVHSNSSLAATAPAAPPAAQVSVATVERTNVATFNEFSGRLEAVERVDVRPRVAGTVLAVHFKEGALVKKGDLLITIDPAPYQADVDRSEAQVASAQARLGYTRSELERAKRLLDEHAIAPREHDERSNAQLEADASLRAAQAGLQTARLSLGYTQVRSPISGRVGRIEITAGNLVAAGPGAPVLTTLVSVSPIYASFDADEQVVTRALRQLQGDTSGDEHGYRRADIAARGDVDRIPVQMGTSATEDLPYIGKLQLVDNQVDARSGTVRVRAVFDNADGSLMPGQFAKLRMGQVKNDSVLLVNERAIGTDQSKKYVMVVGADNKAMYREITLGTSVNGLRIVTSGLKPSERIIVNGLQRVRPGATVDPQPVQMEVKAEAKAEPKPGAADKS
jgi:multidrug efflux system membrane fusion protein